MEQHKAIFITGAASGIGRAVAARFAENGWFVGLADINEAGLADTAAMIEEGRCSIHRLDVRSREEWQAALASFWDKAGQRMDVLFNNAGIGRGGPLADMSQKDVDDTIAINLNGVVHGAEAAFSYLKQTPGSMLLNTASAAGIAGTSNMSIYCATKFAVRGFTEALDLEWDEHGIRVASLMPAFIDTPILDGVSQVSNRSAKETIEEMGMEVSPVSLVADAAWAAVHGDKVHIRVGKSAHRFWTMTRLFPNYMRKQMKKNIRLRRGESGGQRN